MIYIYPSFSEPKIDGCTHTVSATSANSGLEQHFGFLCRFSRFRRANAHSAVLAGIERIQSVLPEDQAAAVGLAVELRQTAAGMARVALLTVR